MQYYNVYLFISPSILNAFTIAVIWSSLQKLSYLFQAPRTLVFAHFAHIVLQQVDCSPLRRRRTVFIGSNRLLLFLVGYC